MTPAPGLWDHVHPESARRLLLAALDAFATSGYQGATTRQIGESAGLSSTGVYVHYKSKSDLLHQLSSVGLQDCLSSVETAVGAASEDPRDRVRAFVVAFARWHAENHVLARVVHYEVHALPSRELRQVRTIQTKLERLLRAELQGGIDAGAFDVPDLDETTLAVLSMSIDLARRWTESSALGIEAVSRLHGELAIRMVTGTQRAA